MENAKFTILIPTWNNLEYLQLCIRSIRENSAFPHQILIHVNEGTDGTLDWVRESRIEHTHSDQNIGICWALNGLRPLVKTDYILYMNDDMYVLPGWDTVLWEEIERIGHNRFFLSSTLLQPRPFYCKSVIAPADFGQTVSEFRETELLAHYRDFAHGDWCGATWPPNVVHRDLWDLVGGYSVELSPGMYSDPDFSAKLWMAGVRIFKGLGASRVYHFESRSTGRVVKNKGSRQFLHKWGITSASFVNNLLKRGAPYETAAQPIDMRKLRKDCLRSHLKRIATSVKSLGFARNLWE